MHSRAHRANRNSKRLAGLAIREFSERNDQERLAIVDRQLEQGTGERGTQTFGVEPFGVIGGLGRRVDRDAGFRREVHAFISQVMANQVRRDSEQPGLRRRVPLIEATSALERDEERLGRELLPRCPTDPSARKREDGVEMTLEDCIEGGGFCERAANGIGIAPHASTLAHETWASG